MSNSRLEKLMEMLKNQPNDPFLIYAIGFEYEAVGDLNKALDYYNIILKTAPDYLPVYYQAGLLLAKLNNLDKAISLLRQGMELAQSQSDKKTWGELKEALMQINEEED